MGIVFVLSHQPGDGLIPEFGLYDLLVKKGGHFLAYALLYWLLRRATGDGRWAFLLAVLYAMSDEYHQTFVPGRNGQWPDVAIDAAGATLAAALRWRHGARQPPV